MSHKISTGGAKRLLFFYEKFTPLDLRIAEKQTAERKFNPSLIVGTARRCAFGCPQVIVCSPLAGLSPFPTSFWLTCPWLTRLAGTAESCGGVGELERWIERRAPREWLAFNADHRLARMALLGASTRAFLHRYRRAVFDRLRRDGIGGTRYDASSVRVKCLHLQTASWLVFRRHPGAEWLAAHGLDQDCAGKELGGCKF